MVHTLLPHLRRDPDAPALVDEVRSLSWAALDDRCNRLLGALRGLGLQHGDVVAVCSGNRAEAFEVGIAALHGGLVVLPVNIHMPVDKVAHVLRDAGTKALVVDDQVLGLVLEASEGLTGCDVRVVMDGPGADVAPPGWQPYEGLLGAATSGEPADQVSGAAMFYTSGTTGRPKGVVPAVFTVGRPVDAVGGVAGQMVGGLGLPSDGTALLVGPGYHAGQWMNSLLPMLAGQRVVMRRSATPEEVLELVDAERVTNVLLVPFELVRLLRLPAERREQFDGSSLRVLMHSGAPCPPEVKRQMIEWLGPKLTETYGGSEAGLFALATSEEWLARPGTVGRPAPFLEVLVLDEQGQPVPPGVDGALYVRFRDGSDFAYHNDPEKTAAAHLEPGVFTLGDVGHLDEDGYLFLRDRQSEVIRAGGSKVYPAELEGALITHPRIVDVAVFGLPDPDQGESVVAAVEVVPGTDTGEGLVSELRAIAATRLPAQAAAPRIEVVPHVPRTSTGKLDKHALRQQHGAVPA